MRFRTYFPHWGRGAPAHPQCRRQQLPDPLPMAPAEAYQLSFCHPQPLPMRLGPDEVVYPLLCEHGAERVEHFLHLRRDRDGVWRMLAF